MKYYGVGTQQVKEKVAGENVTSTKQVIVTYDDTNRPQSRVQQVKGIEAKAKADRVKLEGIYPLRTKVIGGNGGIMSKGIKAQKAAAHAKQVKAHKRKVAIGR